MHDLPSMSPLRITIDQHTGTVAVDGIPGVQVDTVEAVLTIEGQPVRDWLVELGLPKHWETLEAMATPRGYSKRWVRFVVGDESRTAFPGKWRQVPRLWRYHRSGYLLTLAHLPFVLGVCHTVWRGNPEEAPGAEGACVLSEARLYDSDLADAAWRGIQQGIFIGVSPILERRGMDPQGGGAILEIGLTDQPVCPGARILKTWEG